MSTYLHGVYTSEVPTSVRPPIEALAGLPVVFGTAPVVLGAGGGRAVVNRPVLVSSMADFVTRFGYSDDFDDYTLCEFARVYFGLYGMGPAVFVNVLDPDDAGHMTTEGPDALPWADGEMSQTLEVFGIDLGTVELDDGGMVPVVYTGFVVAHDSDGYLVITRTLAGDMGGGPLPDARITYDVMNPAGVDASDVIGAADPIQPTGIWATEAVYPVTSQVPGMLLAPGWSDEPTVMAAMVARAANINDGAFSALVVADLSDDSYEIADKTEIAAWKTANGYTSNRLVCCWPLVTFGAEVHHLSSHFAGLANQTDAANNGTPYVSPSNKALVIDGMELGDGTEIYLTRGEANDINGLGVVTAINWVGWRLWGNRTAAYPASSDPALTFIPIRRMTIWLGNTLVLTFFSSVDAALNRRLIDSVVDSANIYLNGLKAAGAILGGEVIFAEADNPTTSLLLGRVTFRIYWSPPPPAEAITFLIEYDPAALAGLFA